MHLQEYSRRRFVKTLLTSLAMYPSLVAFQRAGKNGIPTRPLGNTGEHVSIIGFGGWHCAVQPTVNESIKLLHEALDNGITFYDNAWEYHNGRSEEIMGRAFSEGSRRSKIFLMTKVCARDYKGAKLQIDQSLKRLRTDHVDLLQFHSIQYKGDVKSIFDLENGGLKAVLEAKKEGKLRFIGFSGHMFPEMHLEMIDQPFRWDTVQLPLNIADIHYNSFQKKVLPALLERNIGVLGMKSLAGLGMRFSDEMNTGIDLCRKYALSLPVSTVITGMRNSSELQVALDGARNFTTLTEEEVNRLLDETKATGSDGHLEGYKDPQGSFGCSYQSAVLRAEPNQEINE